VRMLRQIYRLCRSSNSVVHRHCSSNIGATSKTVTKLRKSISKGPSLEHFIANGKSAYVVDNRVRNTQAEDVPYIRDEDLLGHGRKGKTKDNK